MDESTITLLFLGSIVIIMIIIGFIRNRKSRRLKKIKCLKCGYIGVPRWKKEEITVPYGVFLSWTGLLPKVPKFVYCPKCGRQLATKDYEKIYD